MTQDFPYPTIIREIPIQEYPLVGAWGKQKISSKAGPHGVEQMYVNVYGIQHEHGIRRFTIGQGPQGRYLFGWTLDFYTHPGLRNSIPLPGKTKILVQFVDYLHGLTVNERSWMAYHTFGVHPDGFGDWKGALRSLRRIGIPWEYAVRHLPKEAFK